MQMSENSSYASFGAGAKKRFNVGLRGLAAPLRTEYTSPSFAPQSLSKVV
jgi:hypothetical protein